MSSEKTKNKKKTSDATEVTNRYVLRRPHISEKATDLAEKGFYIFRVEKIASKKEIKKETEKRYGVNVMSVRIINIPSKKRRVGRTEGTRKGYKKAIVKVKKGQSIDLTLA